MNNRVSSWQIKKSFDLKAGKGGGGECKQCQDD